MKAAKSPPDALKILWADGFFKTWKTLSTIVDDLAKRENHFTNSDLAVALLRAKFLTRRGQRGKYEYIQKYPFDLEEKSKI